METLGLQHNTAWVRTMDLIDVLCGIQGWERGMLWEVINSSDTLMAKHGLVWGYLTEWTMVFVNSLINEHIPCLIAWNQHGLFPSNCFHSFNSPFEPDNVTMSALNVTMLSTHHVLHIHCTVCLFWKSTFVRKMLLTELCRFTVY